MTILSWIRHSGEPVVRSTISIAIALMLLTIARAARAEDHHVSFPKGTRTFQAYGTFAGGLDADTNLGSGAVGVGYFVFNDLSLSLEGSGYRAHQYGRDGGHDAWLYGAQGVMRHHLLHF